MSRKRVRKPAAPVKRRELKAPEAFVQAMQAVFVAYKQEVTKRVNIAVQLRSDIPNHAQYDLRRGVFFWEERENDETPKADA